MTDPKNLRLLVGEIRSALDGFKREDLVEVLTYVFKEYVVEGAVVLPTGAGVALDAKTELEGLSFAQLMTWLQRHLDVPELQLFDVEGARVSVRIGGRAQAIEANQRQPEPVVVRAAPIQAPPAPPPTVVQATPRPMPAAAPTPAAPAQPAPAAGQPAQQQQSRVEEPSDTESRFSRLEVD